MERERTRLVYTCQREGCDNSADYKLIHKRYDSLFQYVCDQHLNDDIGDLMSEDYMPLKLPREDSFG